MFKKHFLIYIIFTLFSCSTVTAGPVDWDGAEKYITIQQKQFCDLKNNHVVNLYNAIDSRNEIKINKVKKQRQEDLDRLHHRYRCHLTSQALARRFLTSLRSPCQLIVRR